VIDVKFTTEGLTGLETAMLALSGKLDRVTAVAMTRSAKSAEAEVKKQTPRYINNPTRWTLNSTFVKPAKEGRLTTIVGFNDYSSIGVPAAKYLQLQAKGGTAKRKPYENLLQRKGLLRAGEFAVPSGLSPLGFNPYGNVAASKYVQVLSRLAALREAGNTQNRTDSRRSTAKRKERDYFVAEINGHRAIWARKGKRGIVPVFHFVDNAPRFSARFPVRNIIETSFAKAWSFELRRAVRQQIEYETRKGLR
jgi:hypothetical protein